MKKRVLITGASSDIGIETVKKFVNLALKNADESKTSIIFIDAKDNSNGKCDYKNAYVRIVGKDTNSTLSQNSSMPCKVFPWNNRLPRPTKSKNSSPSNETTWTSFTPQNLNNSNVNSPKKPNSISDDDSK